MGQCLVIIFSPLGGCVLFTPFRLRSGASALSLPESWLFFLLWFCLFTVGSSGAVPRGNFWGSREGWVFQFSPWLSSVLTFFLSFPGCSHPGLVRSPSPGCDCSGLVAWSLLAPRSWKPPSQSTPFPRSVVLWRRCGAKDSLPLVSSLLAARFGLWPYGLAIAAFPLVSRPWTGLCWSHLLSLSSVGSVRGYTTPVGWLRGAFPCFAYCPTSSVLKRSSFGFSASQFASSLHDGVTHPGRVCLSPRSEQSLFLHLPGVWLESSRWGHPVGSGLSQISIGTKTFLRTFPSGWCLAFTMGSPVSGRVPLFCALDRNEGFFRSSILSCFTMGSPAGRVCFLRTLDRIKACFG